MQMGKDNLGHGSLKVGDETTMMLLSLSGDNKKEEREVIIVSRRSVGWVARDKQTGAEYVLFVD